ncbi:MAG: hypothetical protein ACXAAM_08795 [Candidatus Heimdallarchaeaceae archaeon]|jgi:hypothetical protein
MYTKVETAELVYWDDEPAKPIISLKDENDGRLHIVEDDHQHVLLVEIKNGKRKCHDTAWWPKEAIMILSRHFAKG